MLKKITVLFICVLSLANIVCAQENEEQTKKRIYEEIIGGEASKVKKYTYLYDTSLIQAIKKQDIERIKFLLLANVSTNEKNDEGETPLGVAITYPSQDIVVMLLDRGALVNEPSRYGVTPLMTVAALGTGKNLNILLDYGANPDLQDNQGRTALMYAVETLNYDTASALLDIPKIDLSLKDKKGKTAFMHVLDKQDANMLDLFAAKGVKVDSKDKATRDLFFKSVKNNDENMVRLLIACGYKVDNQDTAAKTSFLNAVKNNKVEMAEIFLQAGVNPNSKDSLGTPALITAVKNNNLEMTEVLLSAGADSNIKDGLATPALITAVKNNNLDIARVLLDNKANVNAKDGVGKTPILYAVKNKDNAMIQLLLSYSKQQENKDTKNNKTKAGKKDPLAAYAIDFSTWKDEDINNYITRSEYNTQIAKDTLAARKAQETPKEAATPNLKYTDDKSKNIGVVPAASAVKKPVSKPKAAQKNGQKNVSKNSNAAVKTNNVAHTTAPATEKPIEVIEDNENVNTLVALPQEKPQETANNISKEAAVQFPEMQPATATPNTVQIEQEVAQPQPYAPADDKKVAQDNSFYQQDIAVDTEEDNPYAF